MDFPNTERDDDEEESTPKHTGEASDGWTVALTTEERQVAVDASNPFLVDSRSAEPRTRRRGRRKYGWTPPPLERKQTS